MEISITVKGDSLSDLATKVVALGATLNTLGMNEQPAAEETTPKKGRGKKAKAEEQVEMDLDEETSVEDLDDEDTSEEIEEDDAEEIEDEESEEIEEDEEPAKIDQKQLAQLKKALNSYSAKNGKPKAVKILHKYAKVSQDVKADDFAKIMKALKV